MWSRSLFVCLLLATCTQPFLPGPQGLEDQDADGMDEESDCDDLDPMVFPGAKERENCIDDDCNGQIDEGTANEDIDGDGACLSTGDVGDCEGDPKRHPGASELKNGLDDNCNGFVDENPNDMDNDGYTSGAADCDDLNPFVNTGAVELVAVQCAKNEDCPSHSCEAGFCRCLSNIDCVSDQDCATSEDCPTSETCDQGKCGASLSCLESMESLPGSGLVCRDEADNNCDGMVDQFAYPDCDEAAELEETNALDYARSIQLCEFSSCSADLPCPGEIECNDYRCNWTLSAEFNAGSDPAQRAIEEVFATGSNLVPMRGETLVVLSTGEASYDGDVYRPQPGEGFYSEGVDPEDGSEANDLVELKLTLQVPSNANSFSFDFFFLTAEYPEWLESFFNDTFWVDLQSKAFAGNIAFDANGTPIRVNSAFFDICDPVPPCTEPASTLAGTGYENTGACFGSACGGGTGWLTTTAPVVPNEIIELTFSIFDKGDHIYDSAVLIDNFRWNVTPTTGPTTVD